MDFLVTPRHRWVYVALFFVMAASLINTYASLNSFNIQNVYFNIFYIISKLAVAQIDGAPVVRILPSAYMQEIK